MAQDVPFVRTEVVEPQTASQVAPSFGVSRSSLTTARMFQRVAAGQAGQLEERSVADAMITTPGWLDATGGLHGKAFFAAPPNA